MSQRDHGIDPHRTPCREKPRDSGYEKHQANCETEAQRVRRPHSPDCPTNYLRRRKNGAQAKRDADAHDAHYFAEYHAEDIAPLRAQRHANPYFSRPFRCRMRRHSVNANHRQQTDEQTKRRRNQRHGAISMDGRVRAYCSAARTSKDARINRRRCALQTFRRFGERAGSPNLRSSPSPEHELPHWETGLFRMGSGASLGPPKLYVSGDSDDLDDIVLPVALAIVLTKSQPDGIHFAKKYSRQVCAKNSHRRRRGGVRVIKIPAGQHRSPPGSEKVRRSRSRDKRQICRSDPPGPGTTNWESVVFEEAAAP